MSSHLLRSKRFVRGLVAPLVLMLAVGAGAGAVSAAGLHLALVKSDPADAAALTKSPKAITLWFSQRPNLKLTRLVLTRAPSDTVETAAPAVVDSAGKQISVRLVSTIAVGKYAVNWRTLARDGHAVGGDFAFTVDTVPGFITGSSSTAPKPR